MKAKITSLLLTTLLVSGCSTGFFVSSGYDDIYYSPEDEPIVVVTQKIPVASDNYYQAIDNYETEGILLESEIPVYDTIQGEYFEKGDEGVVVNNYYTGSVYDSYDYNYSRRIRLFNSPFSGVGYYSSFYDPFYWDYDPFFWGSGFYMDSWSRYRMYRRMRLYSPYYSWYSPYDYGGYGSYYGGYGSYYGGYGYSQRPVRSNDVYYGHRRAGASNRAIASSSSPIKRSTTGRSDINNRRTSANNSAVAGTRRSTDSRSTASTYTNNRRTSTDVSGSATLRKVNTTRITPRQNEGSNTSVSRRSSRSTVTGRSSTGTQRYYPSYNQTRTVSKPTYNRSSRTYQSRSSSSSSRSVYSRPSSSRSSSSYSAPTRSSRSSYSGSSGRSSSSGFRSSGSSRSSSSGSRSSSSSSGRSSSSSSSGRRR